MSTAQSTNTAASGQSELTDGLGAWQPIETAPKDKRILLGYEEKLFNGINSVCGIWDDDRYANKPNPFWNHDMSRLKGLRETRAQQPIAWMPLPEAPNAEGKRP